LAILLAEATGPYSRHTNLATDIDRSALARAQTGGPYAVSELENVSPVLLARYFERCSDDARGVQYRVIQDLRHKITFRHHDLLSEPFARLCPFGGHMRDNSVN